MNRESGGDVMRDAIGAAAMYQMGYNAARLYAGMVDGGMDHADAGVCMVDVLNSMFERAEERHRDA